MIITNKEISKEILTRLKDKKPLLWKSVQPYDIERLLNYYNRVMLAIMRRGGFITLPVYKNKTRQSCLRITSKERKIVYKECGKFWSFVYYSWNQFKLSSRTHNPDQQLKGSHPAQNV